MLTAAVFALQAAAETKFKASDLVPADLLANPGYTIDEEVINDGFLNTYVIRSEYGNFQAGSDRLLIVRTREVDALDRLAKSSKTGVVVGAAVDSLVDAGKSPFILAHSIATRPIDTVTGIPGGVARTFGRFFRGAKKTVSSDGDGEGADGNTEKVVGAAEGWLGVTGAERSWAKDLNVDPYTTNDVLQAALKEIARYDAAGDFVGSVATPGMGVIKTAVKVNNMVWDMHPSDLKKLNYERLIELGVAKDSVDAFDGAAMVSPSLQTVITNTALQLEGVENLDALIRLVPAVESEREAVFIMDSISGVLWYHKTQAPVARIISGPTVPVFEDSEGRTVSPLALDYIVWNDETAAEWETVLGVAGKDNALYITGRVEPNARAELEARGWSVTDRQTFEVPAAE